MINTANLKVKVSEGQQTVNLLVKLKFNGLGTNQVEEFVRNDMGRGFGSEKRRSIMVRCIMRGKVEDARGTLAFTRARYETRMAYLERRWGHNRAIMSALKVIIHEQVEEIWKTKKEKNKEKIKHLERKWKKEKKKKKRGKPYYSWGVERNSDRRRRVEKGRSEERGGW